MNKNKNEFGLFETFVQQQGEILSLLKIIVNQNQKDDFIISTLKKASLVVRCSVPTLRKAIKDETLKNNIDYRYNGKRYLFSNSSLKRIKGTI